jgi:acyl-CoA thioester hydrolase
VVITEATCRYRSPAYLGEVLVVGVRATEIRRSSYAMEYEIRERASERLVATGRTVQVAFDFARRRIRSLHAETRRAIEAYEAGSG